MAYVTHCIDNYWHCIVIIGIALMIASIDQLFIIGPSGILVDGKLQCAKLPLLNKEDAKINIKYDFDGFCTFPF